MCRPLTVRKIKPGPLTRCDIVCVAAWPPDAAAGLARLHELLAEAGTSWEDERVRVTQLLSEDLAARGGVAE